jgi:hypothetical protein
VIDREPEHAAARRRRLREREPVAPGIELGGVEGLGEQRPGAARAAIARRGDRRARRQAVPLPRRELKPLEAARRIAAIELVIAECSVAARRLSAARRGEEAFLGDAIAGVRQAIELVGEQLDDHDPDVRGRALGPRRAMAIDHRDHQLAEAVVVARRVVDERSEETGGHGLPPIGTLTVIAFGPVTVPMISNWISTWSCSSVAVTSRARMRTLLPRCS